MRKVCECMSQEQLDSLREQKLFPPRSHSAEKCIQFWAGLETPVVKLQSWLGFHMHEAKYTQILKSLDTVGQARLISASGWQAGAAFSAIPTEGFLVIGDDAIKTLTQLRLGWLPPWPRGIPAKCPCGLEGSDLSTNPIHPLHCDQIKRRGINRRHDGIVQTIAAVCRAAGCQVEVEPAACFFDNNKHPDLKVVAGVDTIMVDVCVHSPQARSYLDKGKSPTGLQQGGAAWQGERKKERKYQKKCEDRGWSFVPAAFEPLGLFGQAHKLLLTSLDRVCEDVVPFSLIRRLYTQGCAAALARGNADVMAEGRRRTELNRFYIERKADSMVVEDGSSAPPFDEEGEEERRPSRPPLRSDVNGRLAEQASHPSHNRVFISQLHYNEM